MDIKYHLQDKKILYIAPRFFGYDLEISEEFKRRGAVITRIYDRPFDRPLAAAITKAAPRLMSEIALPIYRNSIRRAEAPFDLVFVINGQTVPLRFFEELRQHSPKAIFILYLWDSLRNRASLLPALRRYDYVFGSDRADSRDYGFQYRPLFFSPSLEVEFCDNPLYDISFVGTAHTDRAPILYSFDRSLPDNVSRFWYLYLQAHWVRYYYSIRSSAFSNVPTDMFNYTPLGKQEYARVFHQSRAILDIEHPNQHGLTMRPLETIGARKKLVTTNQSIKDEEFYHPDNIAVVDRRNINVDPDFFYSPFRPLLPEVRARYSLAGWLDQIAAFAGIARS